MKRDLTVNVTVELLATETGVWCDPCALPSGVSVLMAMSGLGYSVLSFTRCHDCLEPCGDAA